MVLNKLRKRKKKKKRRENPSLLYELYVYIGIYIKMVRLMCALRAHIKFFIFRNIFLGIEKVVITFSILEKFFSKNEN